MNSQVSARINRIALHSVCFLALMVATAHAEQIIITTTNSTDGLGANAAIGTAVYDNPEESGDFGLDFRPERKLVTEPFPLILTTRALMEFCLTQPGCPVQLPPFVQINSAVLSLYVVTPSSHPAALMHVTTIEEGILTQPDDYSEAAVQVASGITGAGLQGQTIDIDVTPQIVADLADGKTWCAFRLQLENEGATPPVLGVNISESEDLIDGTPPPALIIDFTFLTPTFIVSDASPIIAEGAAASVMVRLSANPGQIVNVDVAHIGGDTDISVHPDSAVLTFTPADFDQDQEVILQAAEDADYLPGIATIRISATGLSPIDLTATENDNEPAPPVIYVKSDAVGANDGSSWADAFNSLQDALLLAAASGGDVEQVWVASGTYMPAPPGGSRAASFVVPAGLELYGGFSGAETTLEDRDPAANVTILSGDLDGDDADLFLNMSDNSYHVLRIESGSPVLDGFVITGGNADGGIADNDGGGVRNAGSPLISRCTFAGNRAIGNGGAIFNAPGTHPVIRSSVFSRNLAQSPAVASGGGAIFNGQDCLAEIISCRFMGNSALIEGLGGAIFNRDCSPAVHNCLFIHNVTDDDGGAVANLAISQTRSPLFDHCTFLRNFAGSSGGGMWSTGNPIAIGIANSPIVTNSIFKGNCDTTGAFQDGQYYARAGTPVLNYCSIQGGWNGSGTGNTDADPRLTLDGRLKSGSPCIDAGDPAFVASPEAPQDIDGEGRIDAVRTDIGADEFIDADADALADAWELVFHGSLEASGSADDVDSDGLSNILEYEEYGSNPVSQPIYVDGVAGNDSWDGTLPAHDGLTSGPKLTIQPALDIAPSGATVLVAPGTYAGAGNSNLDLHRRNMVLRATGGPALTTIDCGSAGRVVQLESVVQTAPVLDGFTLTGGSADAGGALRLRLTGAVIRDCILDGNNASSTAGGLLAALSSMNLHHVTLADNTSPTYGAGVVERTDINLSSPLHIESGHMESLLTTWSGQGGIILGPDALIVVNGLELADSPTVFRTNVRGTGDMLIAATQTLEVLAGSEIDLSDMEPGASCADPAQSGAWGTIHVDGLLLVRDSTIMNTNVRVRLGSLEGVTSILNNDCSLLNSVSGGNSSPAFGGEFFVAGTSVVQCNVIESDGDRYLDLDPDPAAAPRPTIGQGATANKFTVRIRQGGGQDQGELLELRSKDHDLNAVGLGASGAWHLPASLGDGEPSGGGYTDTWVLEKLEIEPDAKVNLTNRQNFDFVPDDPVPEAIYVKTLKLHPGAVLNTGLQRLYYQNLVDETDSPLVVDPNDPHALLANGSRIADVPVLGFSLKIIAMEDQTEFDVRVRKRLRDPADTQPPLPPFHEGSIERVAFPLPEVPGNHAMRIQTQGDGQLSASSVAAHGAFARAGEDRVDVRFSYKFCGQPTDELVVYLSDSSQAGDLTAPDWQDHFIELARIYPPASGPGSIGSSEFLEFSGSFSRGNLNFTRGTYVELELRGENACILIDEWDPVTCSNCGCGNFSGDGDCGVDEIDFHYLASELGIARGPGNYCADVMNPDSYIDTIDVLAFGSRLHDPAALNLCGGTGGPPGGAICAGDGSICATDMTGNFILVGKDATSQQYEMMIGLDSQLTITGPPIPAPAEFEGRRTGHIRLIRDAAGTLYQLHGALGLIRLTDGQVVLPPTQFLDENEAGGATVTIGPHTGGGYPLLDVAFDPSDETNTTLFVVPVRVDPPNSVPAEHQNPYRAAAKIKLLSTNSFDLLAIYGANPAIGSSSEVPAGSPADYVFHPDASRVRELAVDAFCNLFVVCAHGINDNDYILIFPPCEPEIRIPIGDLVQAPSTLHIDGDYLYISTSVDGPDDTDTVIHRYRITRSSNKATGITEHVVIPIAGIRFLTGMVTDSASGDLVAIGFNSPHCPGDDCDGLEPQCPEMCSFGGDDVIFTQPMMARVQNPAGAAPEVFVSAITGTELTLPLAIELLPPSGACLIGDVNDSGQITHEDAELFASVLVNGAADPDELCRADINGDTLIDGADIQPFIELVLDD